MRLFKQKFRLILFPVLLAALLCCGQHRAVTVIKLAHGLDPSHPVHQAMLFFAQRVQEKSNSAMRVDVYPSEQLGSERECIELLQIGSLGMTKVSTSPLEGFVPIFRVLSLPYLFVNDEHRFRVLEGEIGKAILKEAEPFGLVGLCYYDAGSRSFYTKDKPIQSPADLAGKKIRTQESAAAMAMVSAMGGAPTPISFGELYSALQQGIVDGAENNPPSFHLSRHYEVAKYYSLDEHTSVPDVLLISKRLWDSLTDEQRRIVQEAADESAQLQKELWGQATQKALEEVQKTGVQIIHPEKKPFQDAVSELIETYKSQEKIYNLILSIQRQSS